MIDRYARHRLRLGETQIDGDAAPPVAGWALRAPERDATASRAEMKLDGLTAHVGSSRARDRDALAIVPIGPEHAVAPANRAVASRRSVGLTGESPVNRAAMAGALNQQENSRASTIPGLLLDRMEECVRICRLGQVLDFLGPAFRMSAQA